MHLPLVPYRAILRNPDDYPEPGVFNPERFIKEGKIGSYNPRSLNVRFWLWQKVREFVCDYRSNFHLHATESALDGISPVPLYS